MSDADTCLAHISEDKRRRQTLKAHSEAVRKLCGRFASGLKLGAVAALIGLLHDMGKATRAFQAYLLGAAEHPRHSVYGARYAYETWFKGDDAAKRTAVIIALCICGHHAGFQDVLNHDGESPFLDGLTDCDPELYAEAKARFLKQIVDADTLNSMFRSACREVDTFLNECAAWKYAMLSRLLLSFLVDADRWDSACFEYGTDSLSEEGESVPPWASLLAQLESYLGGFSACDDLSRIRRGVSERCKAAAKWPGASTPCPFRRAAEKPTPVCAMR